MDETRPGTTEQAVIIPPQRGRAVKVGRDELMWIVDVEGHQVGDLWVIDAGDHGRWLSTSHTRDRLEVLPLGARPRRGLGQRGQRALLGDLAQPHDGGTVQLPLVGGLADRGLLADQLQPDLVLLQRGQQPLGTSAETIGATARIGHDQTLPPGSGTQADAV
jgi:hypothetical protein